MRAGVRVCGLVGLIGILGLSGCGPSRGKSPMKEKAEVPERPLPVAKEEAEAFNLINYTDDGHKKWEVSGKSANLMSDLIELTDVNAKAYGQEASVTLTGRDGLFNRQTRDMQLQHDVKAVTSEGTTMRTQTLAWNADRQIAVSDEWTTVERANMIVYGQGVIGAPNLKQVRFQRGVEVDLHPSTTITCRGPLEVDYDKHIARFWKDVHVQDPRGDIWADRLDAHQDPRTRQLLKVQCWGHVRIQQKGQVARAHRAIYQQGSGKISLIGHPKITFYPHPPQEPPRD